MEIIDRVAQRIVGVLMEKEMTVPDSYPLSMNALVMGCNQNSNREPAMTLDVTQVTDAMEALAAAGYAGATQGARVPRYEHLLTDRYRLTPQQAAILCELFVRGAQTSGELRTRASRMIPFASVQEVEATLQTMMDQEDPLVMKLPKAPGMSAQRYIQLFGGAPAPTQAPGEAPLPGGGRLTALEHEVATLKEDVERLRTLVESMLPATTPEAGTEAEPVAPEATPEAGAEAEPVVPEATPEAGAEAEPVVPEATPEAGAEAEPVVPEATPEATPEAGAEAESSHI